MNLCAKRSPHSSRRNVIRAAVWPCTWARRSWTDAPDDNGVWLATTKAHHHSLRIDFPHMRSVRRTAVKKIDAWRQAPTGKYEKALSFQPLVDARSMRASCLLITNSSCDNEKFTDAWIDMCFAASILRSGPSAPNGGRPSVRMGEQFDDHVIAAGYTSR
jgi:hypothetical protein